MRAHRAGEARCRGIARASTLLQGPCAKVGRGSEPRSAFIGNAIQLRGVVPRERALQFVQVEIGLSALQQLISKSRSLCGGGFIHLCEATKFSGGIFDQLYILIAS